LKKIQKDSLICIAVKDIIGYHTNDEISNALSELGLKINLRNNRGWRSYAAIISKGKLIEEKISGSSEEEEVKINKVFYNRVKVALVSHSLNIGNKARITISGKEYSINARGLNIVVYDWEMDTVIDSIGCDTHMAGCPCTRDTIFNKTGTRSDLTISSMEDMRLNIIKAQTDISELFFNVYRKKEEDLISTKKRFFQSLPKADGDIKLFQRHRINIFNRV